MTHRFWKMHGAGNDFVVFNGMAAGFSMPDAARRQAICRRRLGVGSDGIIVLEPSQTAHFRMRFYNPDGAEADMCGNGLRCAARLAHHVGLAPSVMRIETAAGPRSATVKTDAVTVDMGEVTVCRFGRTLRLGDRVIPYDFVNTGVPHVVIALEDVRATAEDDPLAALGPAVRRHADFAPEGANVNLVRDDEDGAVNLRTYERGVEAETLACGTGATAAAIAAAHAGRHTPPIRLRTAGGDILTIDFRQEAETFRDVTLTGPAVFVFEGEFCRPESLTQLQQPAGKELPALPGAMGPERSGRHSSAVNEV